MQTDCLALGVIVVDHLCTPLPRLPHPGELLLVDDLPLSIGGCAANAAVDLVRVGVNVAAMGCVGNDPFGDYAVDFLARAGVRTDAIGRTSETCTAASLIINVVGQDRRFIHTRGASGVISPESIPWELIEQTKVLYVGGFLLMPRLSQPGTLSQLFKRARAAGVKTVLDVVVPGPGDYWPIFAELLPETDVFLPNRDESELITGLVDPLEQASKFRAAGVKTVAITLGDQGTLLQTADQTFRAGIYPTNFVGATGAGDAFDAGFIAGMLAGEDWLGCLRWGSVLGASCVRSLNATDSVFTRDEAVAFMREHELPLEQIS
jgi:sugar/nucleoside kinase (ribokinase family)